ncbi:MAG: heme exporter protein CcmD [Gammaproteobacteria bacterium]
MTFLQMGGYAQYVWPAYGITAIVLLLNVILPVRREKKLLSRLQQKLSRKQDAP